MRPNTLEAELRREPFTLAMSSGFFGFFAHAGFVAALDELGLQPAAYAGSSAGALVGACRASGLPVDQIRDTFFSLKREDFWDPRRLPRGGFLRGALFRERLRTMLKPTFEDAAPMAISVFDVLSRKTRVRRTGDLPLAVHASCAVPLMFEPVWAGPRPLLDGGVLDRPGLAGVPPGTRVLYHHLASRSPWRSKEGMRVPQQAGLRSVSIEGLPRLGPNRLDGGRQAFFAAKATALRALRQPAQEALVTQADRP